MRIIVTGLVLSVLSGNAAMTQTSDNRSIDPLQREIVDDALAFFGRHLKGT